MAATWLMATIVACGISIALDLAKAAPDSGGVFIAASALAAVLINLLFWLPATIWLRRSNRVTFRTSLVTGLVSAAVGMAALMGLGLWLLTANDGQWLSATMSLAGHEDTQYTGWTVGHIHYGTSALHALVLGTSNGVAFWALYERLLRKW